jgi:gliding motility associated protien GldN
MKKWVTFIAFLILFMPEAIQAQERVAPYNANSVRPIPEDEIMYRRRVWRRMDLKEKMNTPFFAFNSEITKIIIDAVIDGRIFPYQNDSLITRMTKEEFLENLKMPIYGAPALSDEERAMGFVEESNDWGWGDDNNKDDQSARDYYFFPRDVSILEIMEDFIFDKRRSRAYWDILAVKLIIPADKFETGFQKEVGSFRFKDLDDLFRSMPEEAFYFNGKNQKANMNMADAFTLRLFSANIIKYWNPMNRALVDIYTKNPREALLAAKWIEQELLEFEHNLWSY